MLLIKFSGNWADEMSIKGYKILDEETWKEVLEGIPETGRLSTYIGSNQDMEWDDKKHTLTM